LSAQQHSMCYRQTVRFLLSAFMEFSLLNVDSASVSLLLSLKLFSHVAYSQLLDVSHLGQCHSVVI